MALKLVILFLFVAFSTCCFAQHAYITYPVGKDLVKVNDISKKGLQKTLAHKPSSSLCVNQYATCLHQMMNKQSKSVLNETPVIGPAIRLVDFTLRNLTYNHCMANNTVVNVGYHVTTVGMNVSF